MDLRWYWSVHWLGKDISPPEEPGLSVLVLQWAAKLCCKLCLSSFNCHWLMSPVWLYRAIHRTMASAVQTCRDGSLTLEHEYSHKGPDVLALPAFVTSALNMHLEPEGFHLHIHMQLE